ncbi:MAG: iron chelate uptake ABC transporter family permease subunit [Dehalococcoidia bacterium]
MVLVALLLLAGTLSVSVGAFSIPFQNAASVLLGLVNIEFASATRTEQLVIEQLRLPRLLVGIVVGMGLGVAGATMQALFRNPMADPGIIGVSAGAATGAVVALAFKLTGWFPFALQAFAFAGAIGAAFLVYGIALVGGRFSMATLLLAGIAISAFLSAVMSTIILMVPDEENLRGIVYWLAGGLSGSGWQHVRVAAVPILLGATVIIAFARDLNLLLLGDELARSTGVSVDRLRPVLLTIAAIMTGAAVAVSGTIAFVGLVVPHVVRLIVGPDHRVLMPSSALAGALFIVLADTVARMAVRPAELQVGMVTAFIGAPFFLLVLLRNKSRAGVI